MKTRSFAAAVIAALLLNFVTLAAPDNRGSAARKAEITRLVTLLPASDGVAVFEGKRFLNEALPRLLTANQPLLGEIMAKIAEMENRTGIDLRKFDQVAVGMAFKQISAKETDYEPVAIANGDISAGALIAIARLASNGTYREETISGHAVYIFTPKEIAKKAAAKSVNSKVADTIDHALNEMTKEFAVTAIDGRTLAIGSLPRIRETLLGQSHISAELAALLSQRETTVASFAMRTPDGMSKMVPLEADEFGANIDSIQLMSGSVDVAATGTSLHVIARTKKAEQAQGLKDTLDGLQIVGKAVLGGSKKPDQQVYARLVKSAKFDIHGSEVTFDLLIPQADIDALVAKIK